MTKIHYVMPMAGRGSRFRKQGFEFPKPLIEIYGKPFFYWATQSLRKFVEIETLDFVILEEHITKYNLDQEITKYFPEARIHAIPDVTEGAVITCLNGIQDIHDELPVVFNDCDHLFKSSEFNHFCREVFDTTADGILLTFHSDVPNYSFVKKDDKGNVICTAEKQVISNEAICGCYYFRTADIFRSAAQKYLTKCNYQEYFMSGVYNILVEEKKCVKSMLTDYHVPFGVPEEYETALASDEYKELL